MSEYTQVVEEILSIPKFTKEKNDFSVLRLYLDALGHPEQGRRIIHVAGTNGKGSVCRMLCGILQEAGRRCGGFFSPHLIRMNERIRVNGAEIPDEMLVRGYRVIESVQQGRSRLTFFELLFLIALWYFREADVQDIVLETGMGGRLDATTSIPADLFVITEIGMDHEEYLARSLRTMKRMESLINEILTASRMQSAGDIAVSKVDMSEVIEQKITEADDLFLIRNISVNKDTQKGMIFKGNRDLTALAVGAFISNAVFYSKEGGAINISCHKEGDEIVTFIENEDAHIEEKDLEHLFEPFYRSDSARNSRDGGSGLGLYLAKLIITKQNGNCSLHNTSKGVTAKIIFFST